MNINILPDLSLVAAPFTTVLGNALRVASTQNSDSIIQYSAPARIEPTCLIDAALAQYEFLYPCLGTTNNLISAYYMQGLNSQISISSMRLLREVDNLKPDRNMNAAIYDFVEASADRAYGNKTPLDQRVEGKILSVIAESLSLPVPGSNQHEHHCVVLEAVEGKPVFRVATPEEKKASEEFQKEAAEVFKKTGEKIARAEYDKKLKELQAAGKTAAASKQSFETGLVGDILDAPNLAVGRIFEVTADYGNGSVTIQVLVSLKTKLSTSANLVDIYATGGELRTFKERWHGWKSGELRFVEDILMCSDIIDNHKRTGVKDNTGTYLENRQRDTQNRVASLLTGKASIGTASAIAVFAGATVKKLEAAIGGKMADFGTREKVFRRTSLMIFMVIDTDFDQITVYHRGISKPTSMPVAEYTRSKSKGGSDVADIVKLFLAGTAPTL
jgi:hypothetical protein